MFVFVWNEYENSNPNPKQHLDLFLRPVILHDLVFSKIYRMKVEHIDIYIYLYWYSWMALKI